MSAPALHQLHSHGWMYMIDLQCVKTCQKQIRRKKHVNEFYLPFAFVIYGLSVMTAAQALCDKCAVTVVCLFLRGSESMQWSCDWARSTVGWSEVVGRLWHSGHALQMCLLNVNERWVNRLYSSISGSRLWYFYTTICS